MPWLFRRTAPHSKRIATCHSRLPRHKHGCIPTINGREQPTKGLPTTWWRTKPQCNKGEIFKHNHNRVLKQQLHLHSHNKHRRIPTNDGGEQSTKSVPSVAPKYWCTMPQCKKRGELPAQPQQGANAAVPPPELQPALYQLARQ